MSQKPVIGIVTVHDESPIPRIFTNEHYPKAVIRGGGTPVMLPVTTDREVLQQFTGLCDGFLFSGGQDISPMRYGELQSRLCGLSRRTFHEVINSTHRYDIPGTFIYPE